MPHSDTNIDILFPDAVQTAPQMLPRLRAFTCCDDQAPMYVTAIRPTACSRRAGHTVGFEYTTAGALGPRRTLPWEPRRRLCPLEMPGTQSASASACTDLDRVASTSVPPVSCGGLLN